MKTLLVYATKYGATKRIAELLQDQVDCSSMEVTSFQGKLDEYDKIILGVSVYAGMLRKEMKEFVKNNLTKLEKKKVYVYISSLNKDEYKKVLVENLGESIYQTFTYVDGLGGILDFTKMNLIERQILKMINKKSNIIPSIQRDTRAELIDYERISKFVEQVKQG